MLNLPPSVRIFVGIDPVDMRGSFDALAGHVRRMNRDPLDGHLYFFVNRRRTLMKLIWWDSNGWSIWSKRLERGSYQLPEVEPDTAHVHIAAAELAMILQGVDLRAPRRRRYRREAPRQS